MADLNEEVGNVTVKRFNSLAKSNRALFVKTNVSEVSSIENLIHVTVSNFGAIDCFYQQCRCIACRKSGRYDTREF